MEKSQMRTLKIKLKNINKAFGVPILKNICLNIDNNSFFSICGKSGSGKTTLMNIIGLIESFDSGEYTFNNIKIRSGRDYSQIRLNNIGFIFQSYNLIPSLTCYENIIMPTLYSRSVNIKKKEFTELIDRMQIMDILERNVNVLSGGEKQRVAIARALLLNPELIIADEPTGNLDENNKKVVFDILKEEHEKGRAVIIITHDKDIAMQAEKIYELDNGCLYER